MVETESDITLLSLVLIELTVALDELPEVCVLAMQLHALFVEFALVENLIDQLTDAEATSLNDLQ